MHCSQGQVIIAGMMFPWVEIYCQHVSVDQDSYQINYDYDQFYKLTDES